MANAAPLGQADTLMHCYRAAITAVQPEAAMRRALHDLRPGTAPSWIIAVGKASPGMTRGIVDWLADHGRTPAGGVMVSAEPVDPPHPSIRAVLGNHPIPMERSAHAAAVVADIIAQIPADAEVHIAISGGTSALIAGPLPSLSTDDVTCTFELLISSGLDIREMNAVRKRVTRWSAGRLALQLDGRAIQVWIISDVMGDDLGSIGSGPCTADAWSATDVRTMLAQRGLFASLPRSVQDAIDVETPKPGDRLLASITPQIVARNRTALNAAAAAARLLGINATIVSELRGESFHVGREIAAVVNAHGGSREMLIWGGETVVTITGPHGTGGRSQELALAAAEELHGLHGILLAAGTDGRDGPTDVAGAIVDGKTWEQIAAAGRSPATDLAHHDSYPALNAAGALVRTGPTGTNVMDIVMAVTG